MLITAKSPLIGRIKWFKFGIIRVSFFCDGESAIKKTREQYIYIQVINMKLPVINGLDTYLSIRKIRLETIGFIIAGFIQELVDLIDQTIEKDAYIHLKKPIDMDKLISLPIRIEKENRERKYFGDFL